ATTNSLDVSEHVALATARVDQLSMVTIVDLAAQVADVHVQDVAPWFAALVVNVCEQVGSRHDLIPATREILEERELACRQLDRSRSTPGGALEQIDLQIRDDENRIGLLVVTSHQRAHPRGELLEGERFDHVVVCPGVETRDAVFETIAGGQDQDRHAVSASA